MFIFNDHPTGCNAIAFQCLREKYCGHSVRLIARKKRRRRGTEFILFCCPKNQTNCKFALTADVKFNLHFGVFGVQFNADRASHLTVSPSLLSQQKIKSEERKKKKTIFPICRRQTTSWARMFQSFSSHPWERESPGMVCRKNVWKYSRQRVKVSTSPLLPHSLFPPTYY